MGVLDKGVLDKNGFRMDLHPDRDGDDGREQVVRLCLSRLRQPCPPTTALTTTPTLTF